MKGVPFGPGDAVGIVAPWFVAVIESEHGAALGAQLIEVSHLAAGGFDELVELITKVPLRLLPEFAVGVVELHVVRLLVRGSFAALVDRSGGRECLDGQGFRTWRELSIPRPVEVRIGVPDALHEPAEYWTTGGVVPASSVAVVTQHDGLASSRPAPADEVEPVIRAESVIDEVEIAMPTLVEREPEPGPEHEPEPEPHPAPEPEPAPEADSEGAIRAREPDDEPDPLLINDPSDQTLVPFELDDDPYADVWHTMVRSIDDAIVHPQSGDATEGAPAPNTSGLIGAPPAANVEIGPLPEGDHDGHTRTVESLRAELAAASPGTPDLGVAGPQSPSGGVSSSPCVRGHANPPFAVTCRRCLSPVRDVIESVPRADAGVLVMQDGERIEVDRTIVIGRNPKAEGLFSGDPPRLIDLPDHQDISRTHIVIELSGWTAMVTDQDSMNGTEVQLPGKEPEQLRPHAPMAIVVGTRIILADDVVLRLEGG